MTSEPRPYCRAAAEFDGVEGHECPDCQPADDGLFPAPEPRYEPGSGPYDR